MSFRFLFIALSLTSVASASTVATVNGKTISSEEFQEAFKQNQHLVTSRVVTKKKVLNDLINRQLGLERAKTSNVIKDPIVKKKINDILYHAQISKDLETKLNAITVSNNDVKSYYKSNKEFRTAHILLRIRVEPSHNELRAAMKKSLDLYNILKKDPNKFAELANKYSQSSTATNGGDMGFQPAVSLAPEYYAAIKGKSAGHITSPVKTQFGLHIIKIVAVKDYKAINVPLYKKIVYDQKRDRIIEKYFSKLRSEAKISINEKNL